MKNSSILLLILISLGACKQEIQLAEEKTVVQNVLQLTPAQAVSLKIEVGKADSTILKESLEARGQLDVPPQNIVSIMAPLGGFVKSTNMLQGMKIKKGEVLAILEHPDYIKLQQDYLEKRSQLAYLEAEYIRQEELQQQNANALKTAQQAKANYEGTKAMVAGLEAMLQLAHISIPALQQGNIQPTIKLLAPSNGYITKVMVNAGRYVQETEVLFELVNMEHIHAELKIFEADISKIKEGQKVMLSSPAFQESVLANVFLIGKSIGEDRTIQVHCHLVKEDESFIPGSYVTATIDVGQRSGITLPAEAIIHYEGKDYAFIELGPDRYQAIVLTIVENSQDKVMISLADKNQADQKFVIKGVFQLLGLLKNTGDE
ncbi:efflux RND transporter periplasmic adaptor subunit [Chryseotalea sanaruensis]|uniref:Efflux RND transporter periplasmic adaptor subunit n=1 Tax=Chryseotalea sanaruensis TaxID=2482724 RepID=A0A401U5X5_9BACT|nr:efflux RND transporter periplasmic adaptor subunit [Chryseotalea sanaruensis]GCC50285.1 efflux RND transporter periplasmic adaptor subunit [Chryseotalea sanaruensis]